jgi:hypothetical protein
MHSEIDVFDCSHSHSWDERQELMKAMLEREKDLEHQAAVESADIGLHRRIEAAKRLKKWQSIGDGKTAQGLDLKEAREKEAHREFDEAVSALKTLRGDTGSHLVREVSGTVDFSMVASRQQLIAAFGVFTGMDHSWFKNLNDSPKLKAARKFAGQGGRKHIAEPMFCPYEVMRWLVDPSRKKGKKLTDDKGWQLLESNFQKVYNQYSIGDTRTN